MEKIGRHRREIMGFSIILIMLCHTTLFFEQPLLRRIYYQGIEFCKVGVDIFFLMSGMGLYYSFSKDQNVVKFYKKRLKRILPTYLVVILCWGMFSIPLSLEKASLFLWRYSLISFFADGEMCAWFVAAILVLYLAFPLIYSVIDVKRGNNIYIYIY